MTWQGSSGAITDGTTILKAIAGKLPAAKVEYDKYANFKGADRSAVCVVAVGERPYAEGKGDSAELTLDAAEIGTLDRAREQFSRVVLVVVSGRTVMLGDMVGKSDAVVAAWLPGSEGEGVVDVLFGDVKPTGKLSFSWPASVSQLPLGRIISGEVNPMWSAGYGLTY